MYLTIPQFLLYSSPVDSLHFIVLLAAVPSFNTPLDTVVRKHHHVR